MRRENKKNLNTQKFWNNYYKNPAIKGEGIFILRNEVITSHIIDDSRVIELGCGAGWLLSRIKTFKPRCFVVGIDFSKEAIKIAEKDKRIVAKQADVRKGNVWDAGFFDYAISTELLEHLEKPEKLVGEMARLLKPGGIAFLTTPWQDRFPSEEHLWQFTIEDVEKMFSKWFTHQWAFPWATGAWVAEGEVLVQPSGTLNTIFVIAIK